MKHLFKEPKMTTDGPSTRNIPNVPSVTPCVIDYCLIYSTLYGCASFRHPKNGSIFIHILCKYLQPEFARKYDLKTILQLVRFHITNRHTKKDVNNTVYSEPNEDDLKYVTQVPEDNSTLTKDVYFDVLS